jgi:hypothetical protein
MVRPSACTCESDPSRLNVPLPPVEAPSTTSVAVTSAVVFAENVPAPALPTVSVPALSVACPKVTSPEPLRASATVIVPSIRCRRSIIALQA